MAGAACSPTRTAPAAPPTTAPPAPRRRTAPRVDRAAQLDGAVGVDGERRRGAALRAARRPCWWPRRHESSTVPARLTSPPAVSVSAPPAPPVTAAAPLALPPSASIDPANAIPCARRDRDRAGRAPRVAAVAARAEQPARDDDPGRRQVNRAARLTAGRAARVDGARDVQRAARLEGEPLPPRAQIGGAQRAGHEQIAARP